MKKLLSCLTAGLLAIQGMNLGAFAAQKGRIAVGSCTAAPGETFELPVEMKENPGITALSLSLVYDASKLELLGVSDGKIFGTSVFTVGKDLTAVPYHLNWDDSGASDQTGTGNAALVSFRVKEDASGSTDVSVAVNQSSTFNANMEEVPFATDAGTVTLPRQEELTPVISVGTPDAAPGSEVTVPVILENNPGIAALSLNISYDAAKLKLLGAENGEALSDFAFIGGNDLAAIPYTLNWDSLGNADNTGNGTVASLRFRVQEDAAGKLPVKAEINQKSTFNMDMKEVAFKTVSGAVNVAGAVTTAEAGTGTKPDGTAVLVDTVTAAVGETVKVPVRLQKNPGVAALSLNISYDTAKLKLLGAESGEILKDFAFVGGNDLAVVPYKLNWDSLGTADNTENGIVAVLEFKVIAAGTSAVKVQVNQKSTFNKDMDEVKFAVADGAVKAGAAVTTAVTVTSTETVTTAKITGAAVLVDTVTAAVGETVKVPVRLQKNPGVAALSLNISYDAAKLKLLGAKSGDILKDFAFVGGNDLTAVPYKLNWDSLGTADNTENGIVAVLEFKVIAAGTSAVKVQVNQKSTFNKDMDEVKFAVADGAVKAGAAVTTAVTVTSTETVTTAKITGAAVLVDTVTAAVGETVKVPVRLQKNPGVAALSLNISYDAAKLKLLGAESGDILKDFAFVGGNDLAAVPYKLNWDSLGTADNTENGIVAVLEFKVLTAGTSAVKVQVNQKSTFNKDMDEVKFAVADGAVKAGAAVTTAVTVTSAETATTAKITGAAVLVDTVTAAVGETVKVPVRLQKNPGVAALSLNISYDAAKLKLLGAESGDILKDFAFVGGNDLAAVPYKLNWDSLGTADNTDNGIVAVLEFKVLTAGTSAVKVRVNQNSTFNKDMEEVKFAVADGAVKAGAAVTTAVTVTSAETVTTAKITGAAVLVDTVTAAVGETVKVPVRLQKNPGVAALSLNISYDAAKLKLLGAKSGEILKDFAFVGGNDLAAVPYKLNWDSLGTADNTENGIVAVLEFKVLTAGTSAVKVQVNQKSTFNKDMDEVKFAVADGAVKAGAAVTTAVTVTSAETVTTAKITGAAVLVDTVTAAVGETVKVPVRLQKNPGVAALSLNISYDTAKLKLLGAESGEILKDFAFVGGNDLAAVPYKLNWDSLGTADNTENGIVAVLDFKVLAAGTSAVKVRVNQNSTFNKDMEEVKFAVADGAVKASVVYVPATPVTTTARTVTTGKPVTTTAGTISPTDVPVTTIAKPITTTAKPVTTTAKPVTTTVKPVITTAKPVITTAKPVTTTAKPVATTAKPVTTTAKPVTTTAKPVTTTAKPVTTTAKPVTTTAKPVTTTEKPVTTTAQPVTTTAKPVTTTAKPVTTTAKPVTTTAKPVTTTAKLVTTTAKPVTTTAKPVTTTAKPVTTTAKPVTTTAKPVTTTAKPVTTTAKPVTTTAKPVTTTVKPVTTTAKPVTTTAKPVTTTAKPVTTTAKPVTTTAKPVTTTAKPVTTTAKPVTTTAKPVTTTAKSVTTTAAPVTTTAASVTTTAAPVTTTAASVTTTAAPVTTTAQPVTTEQPVTTTVSPASAVIEADTVEAHVGDTVRVPVRIRNNPGIAALSLNISYDTAKLKLLGAEDGGILGKSSFLAGNDLTAVPYTLNWDSLGTVNNTGNGIVAALEFEVLAEGSASVILELNQSSTFDMNFEEVGFVTVNGAVSAEAAVPPAAKPLKGDVNLDAEVSVEDAQLALKAYTERLAGKNTGLTDDQLRNGDVTGDGILSVEDAQYILIYYVKNVVSGTKITWDELIPAARN